MNKQEMRLKVKYALRFLPDELYVKLYFRLALKRNLDLEYPKTLNEKLQWMKFNYRLPLNSVVSDKYAVRRYVQETVGEKYLVSLIGKWNSFDEIDIDKLPTQFVLKCTHDSGGLVICKDKTKFDVLEAKKKISNSLKRKFYYIGREWQYKSIKPMIIAEKLLLDERGNLPADYKITCFNGSVDNILVCTGRLSADGVKFFFFDKDWNFLRYDKGDEFLPDDFTLEKPKNLDEMIEVATKLADPFPYARIDLYNIDGCVYFGEITLSSNSGFDSILTYEADMLLGNKLDIIYGR